ncbi:1975_t:CDS:2 [Racocetra fulgida]|uniref:1975_t:CDS:1 n=1 Tax=Racocetra fulgida TaxID=60492 RepID=A0A9N9HKD1_9GLOM|nr:1975_t:CDS:2 [Racocetra fulgida]
MQETTKPSVYKTSKIYYKSLKESTSNKLSNIRKRLSTISSLDSGVSWLDESDSEEFPNPTHNNKFQNGINNSNNNTTNCNNVEVETSSICDKQNGISKNFSDVTPLKPTDCVTSKFIEIIEITPDSDKLTENAASRLKRSFAPLRLTQASRRAKNIPIKKFNTLNTYASSNDPSTGTHAQITNSSCRDPEKYSSGDIKAHQTTSTNSSLVIPSQNNKSYNSHCSEIEGDERSRNIVKTKEHKNPVEKVKWRIKKFFIIKNNRNFKADAERPNSSNNKWN